MNVFTMPAGNAGSLHLQSRALGGRHLVLSLEPALDGRGLQLRGTLLLPDDDDVGALRQVASATSATPLLLAQQAHHDGVSLGTHYELRMDGAAWRLQRDELPSVAELLGLDHRMLLGEDA
ncbi:hypothetical protein RKE25_02550 [Dyella sp. BiH032]|uniref:hypothetical protein n=1 Tax=Dyella sp. BiH032 TaxID=3075430 RepID=UPI002892DCFA|nr:hypothetical protein [Dyella sp. BiH032]WNL46536.1 hypothetical protein RKE25_02550 [Dyella sp. BiH032]